MSLSWYALAKGKMAVRHVFSLPAVLVSAIVVASLVTGAAASHQIGLQSQLEGGVSANQQLVENLSGRLAELGALVKSENAAAVSLRHDVLAADTYLSYVKGYWPRLYLQDIAESDAVGSALDRTLSDPEYSSDARRTWGAAATNEDFLRAAEVVDSVYRFVTANVSYESDNEQFGRDEMYVPPDWLLGKIENGENARGDCEDMANLLATLLSRAAANRPELSIPADKIIVKEGIIYVPTQLEVYVIRTWHGLVPLYYDWGMSFFGHAWVELQIPSPTAAGSTITVALEPTQRLASGSAAPWDTWVQGSPDAESVKENGWLLQSPDENIAPPITVYYPLQGYDSGHSWVEFDVWREYGCGYVEGIRNSWNFPKINRRPGMLRSDLLYDFYMTIYNATGAQDMCDLDFWRDYYHAS